MMKQESASPSNNRVILAFLQNQWFKNPEIAERMFARRPELRNEYIKRFLFMGCKTGRVLEQIFGEELCDKIVWEEASPKIAGFSAGVFPADVAHIKQAIKKHNPDVIICFGKVAGDGVTRAVDELHEEKGIRWPVLYGPHPAARQDPVSALRELAEKLRENW